MAVAEREHRLVENSARPVALFRSLAREVMVRAFIAAVLVLSIGQTVFVQDARDIVRRREALNRYEAGHRYLYEDVWDRAAKEFAGAIELEPLFTAAHYFLGWSHLQSGQYRAAVNAFIAGREAHRELFATRNTRVASDNLALHQELLELRDSLSFLQSGRVKGAALTISRIERRIRDIERDMYREMPRGRFQVPPALSLALGTAHFKLRQFAEAEREWKETVAVDPNLGEAHNNLAALYATTGRKKEAEGAVQAAEGAGYPVPPQLKEDIRRMVR